MSPRRRQSVLKKIATRRRLEQPQARPVWVAFLNGESYPVSRATSVPDLLTRREHEILRLVATGETDRGIAERLYLSTRTVNNHVSSILGKLDVPSRRAAVHTAVRIGLL